MAQLQPGWTYNFKFKTEFASLDGVYTVVKIYSYNELVKDKISLYKELYEPLQLTQERFEKDAVAYFTESIFKLVDPNDEDNVKYSPESILTTIPGYNLQEYNDVALAFHIGTYQKGEEFQSVLSNISQEISSALGVDQEPRVLVTAKRFLTDDEYLDIQVLRNLNKTSILNYFSENVKLRNENQNLKARIEKLNNYITTIAKS